jgi:hypothetical protein
MSSADDPTEDDDFLSWTGPGVRREASDDVVIVIAPKLETALRAYADSIEAMSGDDRRRARAALARFVRATVRRLRGRLDAEQAARIDALLRRAGLPPLA